MSVLGAWAGRVSRVPHAGLLFTMNRGSAEACFVSLDTRLGTHLHEAENCIETSPTASLVISSAAIETALKHLLLRPLVFGMIYDDNTAKVIAELLLRSSRFERLLFHILEDRGLDIRARKRDGATVSLWDESEQIKQLRNDVVHKGSLVGLVEAQWAVELAGFFVKRIYPGLRSQFV